MKVRIGIAVFVFVALMVGAGLILLKPPPKPVPASPINLAGGRVQGMREGDVTVYRGIPYAAPPVGALRWRPPQPPATAEGVFVADHFKPVCPQIGEPLAGMGPEPMDEDCLGLNIWTAAKSAEEKRPVIVFLPGGDFVKGGGSSRLYWGGPLARDGVVLVTLNYRIGALGFLAHPDLSRESPDHVSGNYGLLDAIAALRWVQANIGAFGGDPANVTLMGHSAGAFIASDLMTSPLAQGLFRHVIGMSGGDLGQSGRPGQMPPLAQAEVAGQMFQQALGAGSLEEMRTLPAQEIVAKGVAAIDEADGYYGPNRPVIDGHVLPSDARSAMMAGKGGDIDLMVGYTAQEGADMVDEPLPETDWRAQLDKRTGGHAAEVMNVADQTAWAGADVLWRGQQWARLHEGTTWLYQFSRVPPWPPFDSLKAAGHGADLSYVFGYPEGVAFFIVEAPWKAWRDANLARDMRHAWVSFARTGDPNDPGATAWPRFTADKPMLADFGARMTAQSLRSRPEIELIGAYWE